MPTKILAAEEPRAMHSIFLWAGFGLFVTCMLALDLGVFHRKSGEMTLKNSLFWVGVWVALALAFNAGIWWKMGGEKAGQFLAGYLLEQSLSIDNLFVFLLIFNHFRVPKAYQHRALFFGILGALLLRLVFIMVGVGLIAKFEWLMAVFGGFLVFTGLKMTMGKDEEIHPEKSLVLRVFGRFFPVTGEYNGDRFFVRRGGFLTATPMFLVLLMVETTDVIFALDSIPAVMGVSKDTFIIYTSNIFAIMGLRSLFFALARVMDLFHLLNYGLAAVLVFIGAKMMVTYFWGVHIPTSLSLGFIVVAVGLSVAASLKFPKKHDEPKAVDAGEAGE